MFYERSYDDYLTEQVDYYFGPDEEEVEERDPDQDYELWKEQQEDWD